jgi:hypothetical protein
MFGEAVVDVPVRQGSKHLYIDIVTKKKPFQ